MEKGRLNVIIYSFLSPECRGGGCLFVLDYSISADTLDFRVHTTFNLNGGVVTFCK